MKKLLYILFIAAYLFLNTGISIATHYCGDEIKSVSLATSYTDEEPEGCCTDESKSYCCETVYLFVRISDSQKPTAVKEIIYSHVAIHSRINSQSDVINLSLLSPPPEIGQFPPGSLIRIVNCTFLI